ncbi:hypothetical protein TNCV_3298221 [Trichonephila clavipes]|uniref:Uncharacterized protein n=1 Tax=Trichonephila clavipes TaxID=2585209 RepID=A0A8X6VTJ4_TRICX|nr:hypothetical protein TNCV_3298221 [Trichonephila clavipes]
MSELGLTEDSYYELLSPLTYNNFNDKSNIISVEHVQAYFSSASRIASIPRGVRRGIGEIFDRSLVLISGGAEKRSKLCRFHLCELKTLDHELEKEKSPDRPSLSKSELKQQNRQGTCTKNPCY